MQSFLVESEELNADILPIVYRSPRLGWHTIGEHRCFLFGYTALGAEGDGLELEFAPSSAEANRLASGFRTQGEFEAWKAAYALTASYPHAQLAVFASLSAALILPLEAPNLMIDFSNETSSGKTTILRLAASVWGQPNESQHDSILGSWNATPTAIQARAGLLRNLPLLLDDTKRVGDPKKLAQIVYDLYSGQSAARGTSNGEARTIRVWATSFLSNGEAPFSELSSHRHGGQQARIMEILGPPFGGKSPENAAHVHALRSSIYAHFGHAGPRFVSALLNHPERLGAIREEYCQLYAAYAQKAGSNAAANRLGESVALLEVTAKHAQALLGLPGDYQAAIEMAWAQVMQRTRENELTQVALTCLHQYAERNRASFYNKDAPQTPRNLEGRFDSDATWKSIGFMPQVFDEALKREGLEPASIKRSMRADGMLDAEPERFDKKVAIGSTTKPRMICIRRAAFIEAGLASPPNSAEEEDD